MPTNQPIWGKFDGDWFQWQSFRDKFTTAVHNNENISPAYKMQYLTAALKGHPAQIVGPPTDAGYKSAWERLHEIYNDKYMLIQSILNTLFKLPQMEQATYENLRKLIDTFHEAVRQMNALQLPVDQYDQILVHMMIGRLDKTTANAWEMQRVDDMPKFTDLTAFLDKTARTIVHTHADQMERPAEKRKHEHDSSRASKVFKHTSTSQKNSGSEKPYSYSPCRSCEGNHPIFDCPSYQGLNLAGRKQEIIRLRLCFNCLRDMHKDMKNCPLPGCSKCNNHPRHNKTICPMRHAPVQAAVKMMKKQKISAAKAPATKKEVTESK